MLFQHGPYRSTVLDGGSAQGDWRHRRTESTLRQDQGPLPESSGKAVGSSGCLIREVGRFYEPLLATRGVQSQQNTPKSQEVG